LIHRLIALVIVPVILSMAVFGTVSYSIYKEKLIEERIQEATSLLELVAEEIKNPLYFLEINKLNSIIQNIKKNPNVISVYILDINGRVITDGTLENPLFNKKLEDGFTIRSFSSDKIEYSISKDVLQVSAPSFIHEKVGIIRIDFSLIELNQVFSDLLSLIVIIGGIIFLGALVLDVVISRRITSPINRLRDAALDIAKGDLDTRIDIISNDEIGELASAFNKMSTDLVISRDDIISARDYTDNIVRSMADTLIVLSPDCNIQTVNPAACKLLGYSEKELVGRPADDVIDDMKECYGVDRADLFKNRLIQIVERNYLSKDNRKIPVIFSASLMLNKDGSIQGIVCVAQDITERRRTEELLKEKARADIFGFLVSALPVFASGVSSHVRDILVATFAGRFEKNMRPGFEEEMEKRGFGRERREAGTVEPQTVLEAYGSWLNNLFSNIGIEIKTECRGAECSLEFAKCPWTGDARGNPIFCLICRTMVMRSFMWTSLKGTVGQSSSIAGGGKCCGFEIRLHHE
jgi:PAS domain S-box-containing protein